MGRLMTRLTQDFGESGRQLRINKKTQRYSAAIIG